MQTRLAPLDDGAMSSHQRAILAKINAFFGAPPAGPFSVWAHQANVADGAFQIFLAHRYEDKLERRLFELAVVVVARNWTANFPWATHAAAALRVGLGADVVEAIRLGQTPVFSRDDERATYELISELTRERRVGQKTFDTAIAVLGPDRVVALVNAAAFYAMVSISTVAFETPLPERLGTSVRLPPLADLPTAAFGSPPPCLKARLPDLDYDALTPAQRVEVAKVQAHFGRALSGPFLLWAHQPGVANGAFQLYLTHRDEQTIDRRLMETLTITVARSWGAAFLWSAHAPHAAKNGVDPDAIEAIRLGEAPIFEDEEQSIVYDIANDLSADRVISQATFDRAVAILGTPRLVAVVNAICFFTMLCMGAVAFNIPAPDRPGAPAPLKPLVAHS